MRNLNMKEIMAKAHEQTKEIVNKYNVDYQTQLSLCISYQIELAQIEKDITDIKEGKANNSYTEDLQRVAGYFIWKSRIFEGVRWSQMRKLILTGNKDLNMDGTENTNLSDYYEYSNEIMTLSIEYHIENGKVYDKGFFKEVSNGISNYLYGEKRNNKQKNMQRIHAIGKNGLKKSIDREDYKFIEENKQMNRYQEMEIQRLENNNQIDFIVETDYLDSIVNHESLTEKQALYILVQTREDKTTPGTKIFNGYGYSAMLGTKEIKSLENKMKNILMEIA